MLKQGAIRIATYNIHACKGTDRQRSADRIAKALQTLGADIIALQEVDVGRRRSSGENQAAVIASSLSMNHEFFASFAIDGGHYGNAILSRWPITLVKAAPLAYNPSTEIRFFRWLIRKGKAEVRSALATRIDTSQGQLQVINTHLTVDRRERFHQISELLGGGWLPASSEPLVLCGDFNSTPRSPHFKMLRRIFSDTQIEHGSIKHAATFHSRVPLSPIDHILYRGKFQVHQTFSPKSDEFKLASDHLPLVADVSLIQ